MNEHNEKLGKLLGSPITRQVATPAGGVRLETFLPWTLVRRGVKREVITPIDAPLAFVVEAKRERGAKDDKPDTALMRALGLAHHWQRMLATQRAASVAAIAEAEGLDASQVHRLMRLTLLAPEVVERLAAAPDLAVERLLGRPWPAAWAEQVRVLNSLM